MAAGSDDSIAVPVHVEVHSRFAAMEPITAGLARDIIMQDRLEGIHIYNDAHVWEGLMRYLIYHHAHACWQEEVDLGCQVPINLFDEYHSFSFESLADVPQYPKPDDFIMLTDLKAGYHQVKMHPETHRSLGVQYRGQVYYFEHLPFGLSSACRAHTIIMGEVYRPLRQRGQRMSYLIDG